MNGKGEIGHKEISEWIKAENQWMEDEQVND
jgi:hypothetical protein